MLLGDNTYKPLKETFQIMFENVNNDYKCLCLFGKVQGGDYKALYKEALPTYPYPYIYLYLKKRCPFHILSKLAHIMNKLQKKEIILSFSEVPIKGNDTAISCICSKYCNN